MVQCIQYLDRVSKSNTTSFSELKDENNVRGLTAG
jgi:hypothetical protein